MLITLWVFEHPTPNFKIYKNRKNKIPVYIDRSKTEEHQFVHYKSLFRGKAKIIIIYFALCHLTRKLKQNIVASVTFPQLKYCVHFLLQNKSCSTRSRIVKHQLGTNCRFRGIAKIRDHFFFSLERTVVEFGYIRERKLATTLLVKKLIRTIFN